MRGSVTDGVGEIEDGGGGSSRALSSRLTLSLCGMLLRSERYYVSIFWSWDINGCKMGTLLL